MLQSGSLVYTRRAQFCFSQSTLHSFFLPLFFPQPSVVWQVHWPGKNHFNPITENEVYESLVIHLKSCEDTLETFQYNGNSFALIDSTIVPGLIKVDEIKEFVLKGLFTWLEMYQFCMWNVKQQVSILSFNASKERRETDGIDEPNFGACSFTIDVQRKQIDSR